MVENEFASMEKYLIDYSRKHPKRKLYNIDLEDYFKKYPLTKENYEKIQDYLALAKGKRLSKDGAIKLYYMALQPSHLRRYIFETQFELHNMMKAYDELTGKDTAHEHHVGVCDGPTLGRDLFNEGFDTLEEVQKKSCTIIPSKTDNPSTDILALRAHIVSKTLDSYGLENTLWRGALQLVSGSPYDANHPPIYAIEDYGEVKIFFRTKKIKVDTEAIRNTLNGLIYNGNCSGYDISRVSNGDIWVYFNPTYHKAYDRHRVIEKITQELRKSDLVLEEE